MLCCEIASLPMLFGETAPPPDWARNLPAVNATLNSIATVLLVTGYILIRTRRERAHKIAMLSTFAVSTAFLACYLVYHAFAGSVSFQGPPTVRTVYLVILVTHIILAATVPVLTIGSIYLGLTDRRGLHRKWGKVTFPIWLYVSVTGVIIYVMLYVLYPSAPTTAPETSSRNLPQHSL